MKSLLVSFKDQIHKSYQVSFYKKNNEGVEIDTIDIFVDASQEEERRRQDEYDDMCQKIHQLLKPKQADMIIAICLWTEWL